jgi:hypothetical protein
MYVQYHISNCDVGDAQLYGFYGSATREIGNRPWWHVGLSSVDSPSKCQSGMRFSTVNCHQAREMLTLQR